MALFRFLHASDLHFARVAHQIGLPDLRFAWANRVSGTWAPVSSQGQIYVDALAAFAHANASGLDALVLTGDLATTGDPADLRRAYRFIAAPAGRGYLTASNRPTLQATNKPIALLPGNHDRFGPFHLPGRAAFDTVFQKFWHAGQGAQLLWTGQRGGSTLVLVGVDFSLRRSDGGGTFCGLPLLGFLGQGRAYPKRIRALLRLSQQARQQFPNCTLLWVIHFEPDAADSSLALLDDQQLANALQQERVAAILCGHTHAPRCTKTFANAPVFVCGTTTQHASVHGNHLNVLEVNVQPNPAASQVTCTTYRYDPASGQFV